MTAHAKLYPPSDAKRWLSCHGSVDVVHLYPREDDEAHVVAAGKKGDAEHDMFENYVLFGVMPDSGNPDSDEAVMLAIDWIAEQRRLHAGRATIHAEQRLDIPETGEFGTADIVIETTQLLHLADYKGGYVPVEVRMNAQMMVYLLGAIAKYGERKTYKITIIQPNYHHIDGPIRTFDVSQDDVDWFRTEVLTAVKSRRFAAGDHCKRSYCPHRGACATFLKWAQTDGARGWFPSEVNAIDDATLAEALDHAEILAGLRTELRKEAMRRMLQMDRRVDGYKIVKGRTDRAYVDQDEAFKQARELGATDADLYEKVPVSVKGLEDFIKQYARKHNLPRGGWKGVYDNTIGNHIRTSDGGLTLERATDGRPAHRRGNEFGTLVPDQNGEAVRKVTII